MTRHKQHLILKIRELEQWIAADEQLGCGTVSANAYAKTEAEIHGLWEELAHLSHYESAEAMFNDERSGRQ